MHACGHAPTVLLMLVGHRVHQEVWGVLGSRRKWGAAPPIMDAAAGGGKTLLGQMRPLPPEMLFVKRTATSTLPNKEDNRRNTSQGVQHLDQRIGIPAGNRSHKPGFTNVSTPVLHGAGVPHHNGVRQRVR